MENAFEGHHGEEDGLLDGDQLASDGSLSPHEDSDDGRMWAVYPNDIDAEFDEDGVPQHRIPLFSHEIFGSRGQKRDHAKRPSVVTEQDDEDDLDDYPPHQAPLFSHESWFMPDSPSSSVGDDEDEKTKDNFSVGPLLPHEIFTGPASGQKKAKPQKVKLIRNIYNGTSKSFFDVDEEAKKRSHPGNANPESLRSSVPGSRKQSSSSSLSKNMSQDDLDFMDPSLEVFPTDLQKILQRLDVLRNTLDEDETRAIESSEELTNGGTPKRSSSGSRSSRSSRQMPKLSTASSNISDSSAFRLHSISEDVTEEEEGPSSQESPRIEMLPSQDRHGVESGLLPNSAAKTSSTQQEIKGDSKGGVTVHEAVKGLSAEGYEAAHQSEEASPANYLPGLTEETPLLPEHRSDVVQSPRPASSEVDLKEGFSVQAFLRLVFVDWVGQIFARLCGNRAGR